MVGKAGGDRKLSNDECNTTDRNTDTSVLTAGIPKGELYLM